MWFAEGRMWGNAPAWGMAETVLACLRGQVQTRKKKIQAISVAVVARLYGRLAAS